MDSLYILSAATVLLATIIQVLTGFGFGLVLIPLLMYIYPGYDAVLITLMLSLIIFTLMLKNLGKFARWDLIWRLSWIGLLGIIVGITVSEKLNAIHLKSVIGVAILVYVVIQWRLAEKERLNSVNETAESLDSMMVEDGLQQNKKFPKGLNSSGLISGLLLGVAGMPGPPVVAVLVSYLKKEVFLATVIIFFLINNLLVLFIALSFFYTESLPVVLSASSSLIIPLVIGFFIGNLLRKFINDQRFKRIVFTLLILVGITSIWEAVALL